MTLSGTESGVEALSDSELQLYESHTTRGWATVLPPTAVLGTAALKWQPSGLLASYLVLARLLPLHARRC